LDKSLPCVEKNFNLQIHMTIDSTNRQPLLSSSQVEAILERTNDYFEPICMSFSSCAFNVIDIWSYNEIDNNLRMVEAGVVYSLPRRINVFFVKSIYGSNCGRSYSGGFSTERDAQIFIELGCSDGPAEQLAHHMGILLGLLETNTGQAQELVDGSNCSITGDLLCDTPADPYGMIRDGANLWVPMANTDPAIYFSDCEFRWEVRDNNGHYYTPHVSNMMSPYPCKCEFTRSQYLKMVENYNLSEIKQY
jgi:hypothetical protein